MVLRKWCSLHCCPVPSDIDPSSRDYEASGFVSLESLSILRFKSWSHVKRKWQNINEIAEFLLFLFNDYRWPWCFLIDWLEQSPVTFSLHTALYIFCFNALNLTKYTFSMVKSSSLFFLTKWKISYVMRLSCRAVTLLVVVCVRERIRCTCFCCSNRAEFSHCCLKTLTTVHKQQLMPVYFVEQFY